MQEDGVEGLPSREVTFVPSSLPPQDAHVKPTHVQVEVSQQRGAEETMQQPTVKGRREESDSHISESDAAPRQRRPRRYPSPPKRKRSPTYPPPNDAHEGDKKDKKKRRKRTPTPPSSSSESSTSTPKSSSHESTDSHESKHKKRSKRKSYAAWKRAQKLRKFKEGGKNITFLTYDGTYGATDKVLSFIQQYDAAFGDEEFLESSKLQNVSMHFQKSARQWWASLRAQGSAPKTWKAMRIAIMKQFLPSDAKEKLLIKWRIFHMQPQEAIQRYIDKFWELHPTAIVYKKIDFA